MMLRAVSVALVALAHLASAIPAVSNTSTPPAAEDKLVARSGFWNSCRECTLWYWTIDCVCNGQRASCDLNPYISNNDGTLVWYGAGFGNSCSGCNLQSATLGCNCRKMDGSTNWGTINLNDHLTYGNNRLYIDY